MSKVNKNSLVIGQRGNIRALLGRREKPIHIEIQTLEQYIARQNYCWAQKNYLPIPSQDYITKMCFCFRVDKCLFNGSKVDGKKTLTSLLKTTTCSLQIKEIVSIDKDN